MLLQICRSLYIDSIDSVNVVQSCNLMALRPDPFVFLSACLMLNLNSCVL
ncbi:hypothetical protein AB3S75_015274 [Citrus x aurantiifolia]